MDIKGFLSIWNNHNFLPALFEYLCYGSTAIIKILIWCVKTIPALKELSYVITIIITFPTSLFFLNKLLGFSIWRLYFVAYAQTLMSDT